MTDQNLPAFSVSEFVAVLNQTLDYAYSSVTVTGEIANFRVSKDRWIYFDLKDETASVRFFGTVYQLPGPLEDGMVVIVRGSARLHPRFGFSVTVQSMRPAGEGSIKKAAQLLEAKLAAEGLFAPERKRILPYPPQRIGLITSSESAAYKDFLKIIHARWSGLEITLIDVQVQGETAPAQIVQAIAQFNAFAEPPEVLVITRGGGSADDLQAFSSEQVTRAVAGSRVPTVVAIGHEVDISLAEMAADQRASTPSNAAELLVPDKRAFLRTLAEHRQRLHQFAWRTLHDARQELQSQTEILHDSATQVLSEARKQLALQQQLLTAYSPHAALARGYAIIQKGQSIVRSGRQLHTGDDIVVDMQDSTFTAAIKQVTMKTEHEDDKK